MNTGRPSSPIWDAASGVWTYRPVIDGESKQAAKIVGKVFRELLKTP